jgi:DNA-binding IclR family transcriptional regulator
MKAFALLRAFQSSDEVVTSAELSRRAGLPEASGYRLIQTLESVGAVLRDGRGRYQAGFVTSPASGSPGRLDSLAQAAKGMLGALAERFGATAHMGVLEQGMVTYVAKASAAVSIHVPTQVSAQQEAYCSAIGKVLLAALAPSELESFLADGELIPLTDHTITDPVLFRDELAAVRHNGFALDRGEAHPHLACVARPVRDHHGATVGAISLVDRIEHMGEWRRREAREALAQAAQVIADNLNGLEALAHCLRPRAGAMDGLPRAI